MPQPQRNYVAWAAILLTLIGYAVATGGTISRQDQRLTSLEQWREQERAERAQDRSDRQATIQRMEAKQREVMEKLEDMTTNLTDLRAEQRVLHGLRPGQSPVIRPR